MLSLAHFASGFCAATAILFVFASMKLDTRHDHLGRNVGMIAAAAFTGVAILCLNFVA